jgi:hypothetical protein
MSDGDHLDDTARVIYRINHAVVTGADAPTLLRADEFPAAMWARLICQRPD